MKAGRKVLAVILALAVGALAAGCGSSSQNKELKLGHIGWDESIAIANLTKALLEDELGYDEVRLEQTDSVRYLFQGVSTGDMDAFQDVWLPQQRPTSAKSRTRSSSSTPGIGGQPGTA